MQAGDLPPLALRLERRKQPTLLQHGTIDSWDFPTTLFFPSPTESVFHCSRRTSIDERDEKEDVPDEQLCGGARAEDSNGLKLSCGMEREQRPDVATQSAASPPIAHALSFPSKPSSGALHLVAAFGSESLSGKTFTSAVSPTVSSTPSSHPSPSEAESPPPNRSLWRRISRRKSSHGKEAAESRNTFINSVFQRGKGW